MDLGDRVHHIPETGCWLWAGCHDHLGYGRLRVNGKGWLAHRWAWFLSYGRKPAMNLLHKCDTPSCVNPLHLFEGSQADNMRDMASKGRASRASKAPGEKNGAAVLNSSNVMKILHDPRSNREIGNSFGVSGSTVHLIKSGKSWNSVTNLPPMRKRACPRTTP